MTVASASRPRSVFGSARTLWPSLSRRSTTPFQLEESAHAPWTSKIVGFILCASALLVDIDTIADVRPSAHAKAGNRDRNSLMSISQRRRSRAEPKVANHRFLSDGGVG